MNAKKSSTSLDASNAANDSNVTNDQSLSTRTLKGEAYTIYKEACFKYRTAKTNGIKDLDTIRSIAVAFELTEHEAHALLNGNLPIMLDEKQGSVSFDLKHVPETIDG